jgi:hypothetical protein
MYQPWSFPASHPSDHPERIAGDVHMNRAPVSDDVAMRSVGYDQVPAPWSPRVPPRRLHTVPPGWDSTVLDAPSRTTVAGKQ